jgi:hypothetical protein
MELKSKTLFFLQSQIFRQINDIRDTGPAGYGFLLDRWSTNQNREF